MSFQKDCFPVEAGFAARIFLPTHHEGMVQKLDDCGSAQNVEARSADVNVAAAKLKLTLEEWKAIDSIAG